MNKLGKPLVIGISAVGTLLVLLNLFFVGKDAENDNIIVTLTIVFSILLVLGVLGLFLFYKFKDVQVHPSHKKEMLTVVTVIGGVFLISLILGVISGGTSDMVKGSGEVYEAGAFGNLMIASGVWMLLLMPLVCVGLWIKDAVKK